MSNVDLAIIGGSGLYNMPELTDLQHTNESTPFGNTSDEIIIGKLHGTKIAFLPRHGRDHNLTPSEVPYRANIYALKRLGVRFIISVSACGSLREEFRPGHVVVPNQLVDHTKGLRAHSFFGRGLVAHIGVANPFSPELSAVLVTALRKSGGEVHEYGRFITIEGPRFSTKGESNLFRQWGMDIIGMTTSPEAFLAAEAEIAYACMAHVTDYDVWHDTEDPVTVDAVIQILTQNTALAQATINQLVLEMPTWAGNFPAHNGMRDALSLVQDWDQIPPNVKKDLAIIIDKYISRNST